MCIFPYDGTNRIRFTGKGYGTHSQPDASGSPKTYVLCDGIIISYTQRKSRKNMQRRVLTLLCGMKLSHGFAELSAAQNVEMQMMDALAAVVAAVGDHAEAVC